MVISIIALLIALLLPAIKQAKYYATLLRCGSNLRQCGIGVTGYAADSRGYWPDRWHTTPSAGTASPSLLMGTGAATNDLRPLFNTYFPLSDTMYCPFLDKVDLDRPVSDFGSYGEVYGSFDMWFGWFPLGSPDPGWQQRMATIEDDMVYDGTAFNVLMGDVAYIWVPGASFNASHPNDQSTLDTRDGPPRHESVFSRHVGNNFPPFDPGDMNFMFTDTHVDTIGAVESNDPRMEQVWVHNSQIIVQLPAKK